MQANHNAPISGMGAFSGLHARFASAFTPYASSGNRCWDKLYLRIAVQNHFLGSPEAGKQQHLRLAAFFAAQKEMDPRKRDELPWQCLQANAFEALGRTLLDVDYFLAISDNDRFELWRFWHAMPRRRRDYVAAYMAATQVWHKALGDSTRYELALNELAHLYYVNKEHDASAKLMEQVLGLAERLYSPEDIRLAIRKNNYAAVLAAKNKHAQALLLFEAALDPYVKEFGPEADQTWGVRESLAICRFYVGRHGEGIAELRKCLDWERTHCGDVDYRTLNTIQNLADVLESDNQLEEAAELYQEAYRGYSRTLGLDHPATARCAGAARRVAINLDKDGARDSEAPGSDMLARLLASASALESQGQCEDALSEYEGIEGQCAELFDKAAMAACLFGKARMLRALKREDQSVTEARMALLFAENACKDLVEPLLRFLEECRDSVPDSRPQKDSSGGVPRRGEPAGQSPAALSLARGAAMRGLALDLFNGGEYRLAEEVLTRLLQSGFEPVSTRAHLARLCLVTDHFDHAREHVSQGWAARADANPYLVLRLLWFQLVLDMLQASTEGRMQNAQLILGRMKTALQNAGSLMEWTMQPVLEHLKSKLSAQAHSLVAALVAALSDRAKLTELDQFPEWRNATPHPLD